MKMKLKVGTRVSSEASALIRAWLRNNANLNVYFR